MVNIVIGRGDSRLAFLAEPCYRSTAHRICLDFPMVPLDSPTSKDTRLTDHIPLIE